MSIPGTVFTGDTDLCGRLLANAIPGNEEKSSVAGNIWLGDILLVRLVILSECGCWVEDE